VKSFNISYPVQFFVANYCCLYIYFDSFTNLHLSKINMHYERPLKHTTKQPFSHLTIGNNSWQLQQLHSIKLLIRLVDYHITTWRQIRDKFDNELSVVCCVLNVVCVAFMSIHKFALNCKSNIATTAGHAHHSPGP